MASMYEIRLACPSCKDFFPASEWDEKTFADRPDYCDMVESITSGHSDDDNFICPGCSVESTSDNIHRTPIETAKMNKDVEGIICPGCGIPSSTEEWNKEAEECYTPPVRKIDLSNYAWGDWFFCPSCHTEHSYQDIEERQYAPKNNEGAVELLTEEW